MSAEVRCTRCGHQLAGDPTRTADGDHLVLIEGALTINVVPGSPTALATNSVTMRASQPVSYAWCSTICTEAERDLIAAELVACTLGARRRTELRTDAWGRIVHAVTTLGRAVRQMLPRP